MDVSVPVCVAVGVVAADVVVGVGEAVAWARGSLDRVDPGVCVSGILDPGVLGTVFDARTWVTAGVRELTLSGVGPRVSE